MPRNPSTGVFTRVSNSFSEPVMGTLIDPVDAIDYYDDVDGGLSFADPTFVGTETVNSGAATALVVNTTATSNALTINAQGDIGVGALLTPDPTHHLSFEILRSTDTDAAQTIRNRNDGNLARAVWHGFAGTTDQVDASISVASPAAGGYVNWRAGGTTGGFNLIQSSNDLLAFFTNDLERMRISASGGVGVGAIGDPGNKNLWVAGSIFTATPVTLDGTSGTVGTNDSSVILNPSGGFTLTLPLTTVYPGRWLYLKNISAQTIISAGANVVQLAGGAASTALLSNTAGKWAILQAEGVSGNWQIMAAN